MEKILLWSFTENLLTLVQYEFPKIFELSGISTIMGHTFPADHSIARRICYGLAIRSEVGQELCFCRFIVSEKCDQR